VIDRRRPLLVNRGEEAVDAAVSEAATKYGGRVFPKVRVADALNIQSSGLSDAEYRYALKAHFDFVVVDESNLPQFAIEFDEPHHDTDPDTILRDQMKASTCERLGLPLVRVDAGYLRRARDYVLVGWLVEVWFAYRWFVEAKEQGEFGPDEPWGHQWIAQRDSEGRIVDMPLDLSGPARSQLIRAPEGTGCYAELHKMDPQYERIHAVAFVVVELRDGSYIISEGRCRLIDFPPFEFRGCSDLARDLALIDAADKLALLRRGEYRPATKAELDKLRADTSDWFVSGIPFDELRRPGKGKPQSRL
jgi:hypothetical protein